jgi:TonB family protein
MRSVFFALAIAALAGPAVAQAGPAGTVGGADLRTLFSTDDYPAEALKRKEGGTVQAELTVGTDGHVKGCKILRSSGSPALDTATCNVLTARAKFKAARDWNGNAVDDRYVTPLITWLIEDSAPAAPAMRQVQPGRYACNTAAGEYGQQDIIPLQPGKEMRLAFRLVEENVSEEREAMAAVYFIGPNGKSRIAVGKAQNDRTQIFVAVSTPGAEVDDVIFQFPVTDKWIALTLNLDKRGQLTVRSNDLTPRYQWGPVTRTYLHCNSGNWEFDVWPRSYAPAPTAARSK